MIETRATGASVGSSIKPDHQIPMKTPNPMNSPQIRLNHLALMVAAAALVMAWRQGHSRSQQTKPRIVSF